MKLAYRYLFGHLGNLARLAWPWVALVALWEFAVIASADDASWVIKARDPVTKIALFVGAIATAVAWHRAILLDEPVSWIPRFRQHEWRYLWTSVKLSLLLAIPAILFTLIYAFQLSTMVASVAKQSGTAAAIGLSAIIFGSFSLLLVVLSAAVQLAFPAAAIGAPMKLFDSLDKTKDNVWRLLACWVLVVAPYYLVGTIVRLVADLSGASVALEHVSAIAGAAWVLLGAALAAGTLSFSFGFLTAAPPDAQPAT